jgi:hypothetical protein
MSPIEFVEAVWPGSGKWDYKAKLAGLGFNKTLMDQFGNFHYGMVSNAFGLNLETSMLGGGFAQNFLQRGGNMSDFALGAALWGLTLGGGILPDSFTGAITSNGFGWGDNNQNSGNDSMYIMHGWSYYENYLEPRP